MVEKSKITGKFYTVSTLSESEKIALGFTDEIINELKEVPKAVKKNRAKKTNIKTGKVVISKPSLNEGGL